MDSDPALSQAGMSEYRGQRRRTSDMSIQAYTSYTMTTGSN